MKNMMSAAGSRKRGLNRALADAGLGKLLGQLAYKTRLVLPTGRQGRPMVSQLEVVLGLRCGGRPSCTWPSEPTNATTAVSRLTEISTQRSTWRATRNKQRTRVPGSSRVEPTVSRHRAVTLVAMKPEPEPK